MRRLSGMLAMAVLATVAVVSSLSAADRERPFGGPNPERNVEERPFGGPPPSNRAIKFRGTKCKTDTITCTLEKAKGLGAPCTCAGTGDETLPGKVE
jgi:hypothetical protein